ncbi:MAG: hypothetical protein K2Y28_01145 [Burkholderiaceae bacterium]|nr:hypothetical protein [Burkholderiaceae bacterium]
MRQVKIPDGATPPQDWLDEAEIVTTALRQATNDEERKEIIKKNEFLWRDDRVRTWLLSLFANKCWYTEAKESVSSIHVDHYRPKGRVTDFKKNQRDGYWWLAFNWVNYRICGQLINIKKSDIFPIVEANQATPDDPVSLKLEAPILIDPITDDACLISYEMDEDGCIAVPISGAEDTDISRVDATIEILGLNRLDRLNQKRADTWQECRENIVDYSSASKDPHCMKTLRQAIAVKAIQKSISYEKEFSSVAAACLSKTAPEIIKAKVNNSL